MAKQRKDIKPIGASFGEIMKAVVKDAKSKKSKKPQRELKKSND